jgi:AcrR family transcriptional regulator
LLSSLALFSTKGYDATSVREICEAAGITKPTLYHFYGSKEGVYRALVDGILDPFRADVAGVLAEGGPVRHRLRKVARSYFDRAGELAPGRADVRMLAFMGSLAESVCAFLIIGEPELTPELADALVDTVLDGWTRR